MVFGLLTVTGLTKVGGDIKPLPNMPLPRYKMIGYPGSRNIEARTSSCHMLKNSNNKGNNLEK